MQAMIRRFAKEHGQAVLEFALLTPFLLAFVLLIVDSGLLAFSYVSASNAAREGARCGTVGGTSGAIASRVANTYGGLATPGTTQVSYWDDSTSPPTPITSLSSVQIGDDVKVTTPYTYTWFTSGFIPGISPLSFTKSADMRMETTGSQITQSPCQ